MNKVNFVPVWTNEPTIDEWNSDKVHYLWVDSILNNDTPNLSPEVKKKVLCTIWNLQFVTWLKDLDLFMIVAESTRDFWVTRNPILYLVYKMFLDKIPEEEIFKELNILLERLEKWNVDEILDELEERFSK